MYSDAALNAIERAVASGDTIYSLIPLGMASRAAEILEEEGIYLLKDLLSQTDKRLLRIKNFGRTYISQIRAALARFHESQSESDEWESGKYYFFRTQTMRDKSKPVEIREFRHQPGEALECLT